MSGDPMKLVKFVCVAKSHAGGRSDSARRRTNASAVLPLPRPSVMPARTSSTAARAAATLNES